MVANVMTCDGYLLKRLVEAGLIWLENNQDRVNSLNVFPVPDGDTGTNMLLTMRKAYEEIASLDDNNVSHITNAIAQGALMGARGNSGVILSQWWKGFAKALEGHSAFDADLFVTACRSAVETAYKGVGKPVEGTILTVTRQAMEAVAQRAPTEKNLKNLFETKLDAANESLRHTPDLLPILKSAGVVDSGGQGWTYIVEGMLRSLRGEEIRPIIREAPIEIVSTSWQDALEPEDEEGYGYDVQFLMHGTDMDIDAVRAAISEIGWSTLVVGSESLIKVHVHVHDPGVPLSYAIQLGTSLDDVVVENMQRQYQSFVEERIEREEHIIRSVDGVGIIAVVSGSGFQKLFLDDFSAAAIIPGGQTMNPSAEDFIKVIENLPNQEIIILPNNPNILMAARQAAELVENKRVAVVPSRSLPQGITAALEYSNERASADFDTLQTIMTEALTRVISCEVTYAVRDQDFDGITVREGQLIGLLEDVLVVVGDDTAQVITALLHKANADTREIITLYYGSSLKDIEAENLISILADEFREQTIEIFKGNQPLYPYIISVE